MTWILIELVPYRFMYMSAFTDGARSCTWVQSIAPRTPGNPYLVQNSCFVLSWLSGVTGNLMYSPACRTRPDVTACIAEIIANCEMRPKGMLERPRCIEMQCRCNFHFNGEGIGTACISPQLICQEMADICDSLTGQA